MYKTIVCTVLGVTFGTKPPAETLRADRPSAVMWWCCPAVKAGSLAPPPALPAGYLVVEVLPVVLRHQAEQGQEGPAEGVEAGVAVVRVPSHLQTVEAVGTLPVRRTQGRGLKLS